MAWVVPKTNWNSTTRNNSEDFARQCDNIGYISTEILPSLYYHPEYKPVPVGDKPTYSRYNAIEDNLEAITNCGISLPVQSKNICPTNFFEWESGQWSPDGSKGPHAGRLRLRRWIRVFPSAAYFTSLFASVPDKAIAIIFRAYNQNGIFTRGIGGGGVSPTILTTTANEYYLSATLYSAPENQLDYDSFKNAFATGQIKPFTCLNSEPDKTYVPYSGWESSKEWVPGEPNPSYQDANRWERNVLLMYQQYERIKKRWPVSGIFASGQSSILPRMVI